MIEEDDHDDGRILEIRPGVTKPQGMPGPEDSPAELKGYAGQECRHDTVRLDPSARTVECSRCDATLDAFGHLLKLGAEWSSYASWVRHNASKRDDLLREIEQLKHERTKLKSEVRRSLRRIQKEGGDKDPEGT